ncbi:hypothetical protein ACWO4B_003851 [Clostridium sporogenes]
MNINSCETSGEIRLLILLNMITLVDGLFAMLIVSLPDSENNR